jgi:hypothetical protein
MIAIAPLQNARTIAPPLVKPFEKAIGLAFDLRSLLHDEIAQEVEAIGFPISIWTLLSPKITCEWRRKLNRPIHKFTSAIVTGFQEI